MAKYATVLFMLICLTVSAQSNTPHTVSMDAGSNNAAAFTSNGVMGTDAATFYVHWDNTYLYLGWSGGQTNYLVGESKRSDMYYAAIDTDPEGTNGTSNSIEGVGFESTGQKPDYYVVYENNASFYGAPVTNGSAFEIYNVSGGNWNFISRTGGDDGTSSQIVFSDNSGEVRLRVAWSTLGFTPGSTAELGIVMWTNNGTGNFMWGRVPTSNPSTGVTPKTLTHQFVFNNTGSGINPSASGSATALPVELSSFEAKIRLSSVVLNWTTATEVNNFGFEIERKAENKSWEKIGFEEGYGNSFSEKEYSYQDNSLLNSGKYYYRLKQIDTDGSFEYSNEVEIRFAREIKYALEQNYPNPFNPTTKIEYSVPEKSRVRLVVYNLIGEIIQTLFEGIKEAGTYEAEFNAGGLSSGIYFYKLEADKFSSVKKMIVTK